MSKLAYHRDKCIGCMSCVMEQPEHWEMNDEDGRAILKDSKEKKGVFVKEIRKDEEELSKTVCEYCSGRCIKFEK